MSIEASEITGMTAERTDAGRPDLVIALLVAAVVFGWNYRLERDFDRLRTLTQYDVLFNADPITRLDSIANGKALPNEMVIHPGFKLFFSRPIRLAGKLARAFGAINSSSKAEYDFRRSLGLLVVPTVSGLTIALTYGLLLAVGLPRRSALLMSVLAASSFSQLIFGSVPDHMPVTGLSVAICLALVVDMAKNAGSVRFWPWTLAGAFTTTTTITNSIPFALVFATSSLLSTCSPLRAIRRTLLICASSAVVSLVIFGAGRYVCRSQPWPDNAAGKHASGYLKNDIARAPAALLDAFSPHWLVQVEMPPKVRESNIYSSGGRIDPTFYTDPNPPLVPIALMTALTISGTFACWRGPKPLRVVGAASAVIVAFNLALFSVWGDGFFLYSQHWLVAQTILLAGNLTWSGWTGRVFRLGYAGAGVAMFLHNSAVLGHIFQVLGGTTG